MSRVLSLPRLGGSCGTSGRFVGVVCPCETSEVKIRIEKMSSRRDGIIRTSFERDDTLYVIAVRAGFRGSRRSAPPRTGFEVAQSLSPAGLILVNSGLS